MQGFFSEHPAGPVLSTKAIIDAELQVMQCNEYELQVMQCNEYEWTCGELIYK